MSHVVVFHPRHRPRSATDLGRIARNCRAWSNGVPRAAPPVAGRILLGVRHWWEEESPGTGHEFWWRQLVLKKDRATNRLGYSLRLLGLHILASSEDQKWQSKYYGIFIRSILTTPDS